MKMTDKTDTSRLDGILFDLDGTLLNIQMQPYIDGYIDGLSRCFEDLVDRMVFAEVLVSSAYAMLSVEDEHQTNEQFFLELVARQLGIATPELRRRLEHFCRNGLHVLEPLIEPFPEANEILQHCFQQGMKVALATNPVFPLQVIEARLRWAGIDRFPFHLVASYESCRFCKPHPRFFADILEDLGLTPEKTLMVGNDTHYDLAAGQLGILTYLVDTCLIDQEQRAKEADFRGGHRDLLHFIRQLKGPGGD